jgi:hypothetical protein
MHRPFSTRDPYPSWYRNLPIAIDMPWRNLGCLGIRIFGLYADIYRSHGAMPPFRMFIKIGSHQYRPLRRVHWSRSMVRLGHWFQDICEHASGNCLDTFFENGRPAANRRYRREWMLVFVQHLYYDLVAGPIMCRIKGHGIDAEEHGNADTCPMGSWMCRRCGKGGGW